VKRADAELIGDELLAAVRELGIPHEGSGTATVLTVSVGVACVQPLALRSWAGIVQLADQALYAAKDHGRNRVEVLEQEYEHMQTGYFHRKTSAAGQETARRQ
jgi:diguanylate cyclase (GGDEF)-like protein